MKYLFTLKTSRGDITITVDAPDCIIALRIAQMLLAGKFAHYSKGNGNSFTYDGTVA